ncbi:Hsp33 family molecular chaperone HslO [Teredinibacter purpureus]|uniref:Hsp33 family molecular chaperone HslO n=1 Tax=Teredinibacter purpureus TaxID=2731756 RepID=UPI0005F834DC|nr:Hsp33 family molecular chaperone HslO [Teredinibacter purpureus]
MTDTIPHDQTHRFTFNNTDIRGQIVTLSQSYRDVLLQQTLPSVLLPILGEFISAVALLSETLKFDGTLTLQVRGDGNVPLIMAEATNTGHIRGILRTNQALSPNNTVPSNDVFDTSSLRSLVGSGVLTLTVDPTNGQRYQGIVPLEGDHLGDCLAHYFEQSEQLPTRIWLFANDTHCGGLMLQSLPAQQIKDLDEREQLWSTSAQLAGTLNQEELFSLSHEQVLYRLFNEFECHFFPARDITFKCSCSRQRSENAIVSLGREEAFQVLNTQQKISIDCQFCGKHYAFKKADIQTIFGDSDAALH